MRFPEAPGTGQEDKVVGAREVIYVFGGGVDGELDDVGALDELCAGHVVVLRVAREGAVVEDEDAEEAGEAVKGPHGDAGPEPWIVHACCGELEVAVRGRWC